MLQVMPLGMIARARQILQIDLGKKGISKHIGREKVTLRCYKQSKTSGVDKALSRQLI
jgi:hypothetical protein